MNYIKVFEECFDLHGRVVKFVKKLTMTKKRQYIRKLINSIPRFFWHYKWVILDYNGTYLSLFLFKPSKFMKFLDFYQTAGKSLMVFLSSIMSRVAARIFTTVKISASYGCRNLLKHGGINDAEHIFSIPAQKMVNFVYW